MAACTLLFEGQLEVSTSSTCTSFATINFDICMQFTQEVNIKEKRIYDIASKFGYVESVFSVLLNIYWPSKPSILIFFFDVGMGQG